MKKTVFLFAMLLPQLLMAYTITGKVIDSEKEPMIGANVVLYKDSATTIGNATADVDGRFALITDEKGNLSVSVSMIGSTTSNIRFEGVGHNIDLGTITLAASSTMLGEVVVEAQNVVEKGANYIVFPSATEIKQSGTSIDLLEQMQYKLPGLQVNSTLNRVTIENGIAIFQINGRQVDYSRIQSLSNDNILRIEYSNVSDIRYGTSVMGVINFITKPTSMGGSVLVNAMGSLSGIVNDNVGATFNYGKSEWTIDYGTAWKNFDKVYNTGTEMFIGRVTPIERELQPMPSAYKNLTNKLSLGYSYMSSPSTMFAMTLGGGITDLEQGTNSYIQQAEGNAVSAYQSTLLDDNNSFSPSVDLYLRHQFGKTSKIEFNAYGSASSSDYSRMLDYNSTATTYSQYSANDNSSWRAGGEVLYTKSYSRFETKYGINYYHNYAENRYSENGGNPQQSKQNNDNVYLYGSISGRIKQFTYNAGIGGRYFQTDNGAANQNALKLNAKITLNYKLNPRWSVNYLFMLDPSMPTLSSQSDVVQRIDDVSYSVGNPGLKPSTYFRNRVFVRYATPKINVSLWAAHSRNLNPIYQSFSYISDANSPYYNMFMSQSRNARHDDLINVEAQIGYTGVKNLMIYALAGWDRFTFSGFGDIEPFENFYANVSAAYSLKNWRFSGRYEVSPRYSLLGNVLKTPERGNAIMVQYKWRDFWFTAGVINPFTRRGALYKSKELSDVHPVNSNLYVKDGANAVMIGLTYRINFGKTIKKEKQTLRNSGVDAGIESTDKLSPQ